MRSYDVVTSQWFLEKLNDNNLHILFVLLSIKEKYGRMVNFPPGQL